MSAELSPFVARHIGPREDEIQTMLEVLGYATLDDLTQTVIPEAIQDNSRLDLPQGISEHEALAELQELADQNIV